MLRGSATPSEILSSVKDVFHPGQNIPERSGTTPFDPAIQHPQHHHHNYALAPDDGLFLQTPSPLTQSEAKLPDPLYVPAANQDVTMRPTSATRLGSPLAYEDHAMPGYRGRRASERPLSSPRMGTRPGSSRRDIMELTSVSLVGKQKSAEFDDGKEASEDVALAKWRKWVVEKPLPPNTSPGSSPNKSRKNSPASQLIPLAPLSATSSVSRPSPLPVPESSRIGASSSDRSDESRHSRTAPSSSRFPAYEDDDFVIYNTESIRALRDVELAVDENVFANQISNQGRRMSTNPRLSNTENHFNDLATRLSSRRVRPLVLELIQALGHYVDAVWCTTHPDIPCPWSGRSAGQWTSTMITAVQQGKEQGYVSNPPTMADVRFWESEVKHTTRDVDDVVGIYKGEQWAFNTALTNGRYGDPDQANVLGNDGEGGNMARLLNDLEEALWGDAPPRPTDLAFELPADFDPYAIPEPSSGINTTRRSGSLSSAKPTAPAAASAEESGEPKLNTWNLDAFKIEGDGLTLEEIGRRRHQEWLKSKQ